MDDDHAYREDTIAELKAEARAEKRWRDRLAAHPDPRDPEWPGHEREDDSDD